MSNTPSPSAIIKGADDFDVEAALGRLITGERKPLRTISQMGFNPAVGGTSEGIWAVGGSFTFLEAPEQVRIAAGGDVADIAGGDGARLVSIEGIAEDLTIQKVDIITNGVNVSEPTDLKFWRVWQARVEEVGLYGASNVGDLIFESVDTSMVLVKMTALGGTSHLGLFSTPIDHYALLRHILVSVEGTKIINMDMCRRDSFNTIAAPHKPFIIIRQFSGLAVFHTDTPKSDLVLPPLTDLFFRATTPASTSAVSIAFDILLVPTT